MRTGPVLPEKTAYWKCSREVCPFCPVFLRNRCDHRAVFTNILLKIWIYMLEEKKIYDTPFYASLSIFFLIQQLLRNGNFLCVFI